MTDVHKNFAQKQLTAPACINNKILQHGLLGKVDDIQLKRSG